MVYESASPVQKEQTMKYQSSYLTEINVGFLRRYSLQGDTKKYFSIGKYSGELKTVQALDREENSTYTMEVIAVDGRKIAFIMINTTQRYMLRHMLHSSEILINPTHYPVFKILI